VSVRKILIWPNPVLQQESLEVGINRGFGSPELKGLIRDLLDTMYVNNGVGLAAIQVGVDLRMFVMRVPGEHAKEHVCINPTIVEFIDEARPVQEGCLSLPGIVEITMRHPQVIMYYWDELGVSHKADFYGIEAQCVQHENDHLNGKLFVESMGRVKRDIIKRKIQKTLRQKGR
jgi:peptide deformylase